MQRRWFLSYHSSKHVLAGRLKAAIERNDPASRVFFALTNCVLAVFGLGSLPRKSQMRIYQNSIDFESGEAWVENERAGTALATGGDSPWEIRDW